MSNKIRQDNTYHFKKTPIGLFKYVGEVAETVSLANHQSTIVPTIVDIAPRADTFNNKEHAIFKQAAELHRRMNHISDGALCKLLDNGGILNTPVTSFAVRKFRELYGPCLGCLYGKMTAPSQPNSLTIKENAIGELLHADLYFINKQIYLMSIDDRTGFVNVVKLINKQSKQVLDGFRRIIAQYRSKGHVVKTIRTDREATFLATRDSLNDSGIEHQTCAPGQHIAKIERAIRTIKGRYRSVIHSLPYILPESLLPDLNLDIVQTMNITPNVNTNKMSPRELVFGTKIDANKVLRASFGDLVITHVPNNVQDRSTSARGELGIIVGRDFTDSGSVKFWGITNNRVVARQKFSAVELTDDVLQRIDKISAKNIVHDVLDPFYQTDEFNNKKYFLDTDSEIDDITPYLLQPRKRTVADGCLSDNTPILVREVGDLAHQNVAEAFDNNYENSIPVVDETFDNNGELKIISDSNVAIKDDNEYQQHKQEAFDVEEVDRNKTVENISINERAVIKSEFEKIKNAFIPVKDANDISNKIVNIPKVTIPKMNLLQSSTRVSERVRTANPKYFNDEFVNIAKKMVHDDLNNISIKKALREMPEAASESIKKELVQIMDMGALKPILKKNTVGKKLIHSKTFLKKKYLPNKAFDKLKARLVVRGDMQFRHPWVTALKAPTVAQASVNMTIARAAYYDDEIESIDITGAYLHADTPGDKEIVIIGRAEAIMLLELYPEFDIYLNDDGTIYMTVDKAMYGMIDSARHWFENITNTLLMGGYVQNPSDECVFTYSDSDNNQSVVDLWVDDLLHTYAKNCFHLRNKLRELLIKKYKNINIKDGDSIPYCGMQLEKDKVNGGILVSAPKFMADLFKNYNIDEREIESTPTPTSFMNLDNENDKTNKFDTTAYASLLMKIMWLARLCRNDILFAVSYMATKVKSPIEKDMKKLMHILRYINGTKELKTRFKPESLQLFAYIDASFGLHEDTKGQTGIIITLGKQDHQCFVNPKSKSWSVVPAPKLS
jgi:hypothetical protein